MNWLKKYWKFYLVLVLGAIHGILTILNKDQTVTAVILCVIGVLFALEMIKEMIETFKEGRWGVDVLAVVAIPSMIFVNDIWAEWMILVMLTGGESLEDYATSQADKDLKALLNNAPRFAHKLLDNGSIENISVDQVAVGDLIVINPGDQVPVDCQIISGDSQFDESSITGESLPVPKKIGDDLFSGSVNGDYAVKAKVTKLAAESEYQTIVNLVKSAQAQPARFVKLADRYAVPFTIISLIIGFVAMGISMHNNPSAAWSVHFMRFAQVMVVASPCPLLIAAPVAFLSGMSNMSRHQVQVKSGPTIEKLGRAKTFAFDKTGTLTKNSLVIDQIKLATTDFTKDQVLLLTRSAESHSNHIIANSIVKSSDEKLLPATNVQEIAGQGLTAEVDGHKLKIGKASFVTDDKIELATTTAVYVAIDDKYAGVITLKDQLRPETPSTIQDLKELGIQHIMMLTGDKKEVAEAIGKESGVGTVKYELLPGEKIQAIKSAKHRPVVMVGDGVNDSPSLTAADVGIAMGAKEATAASESADAVILVDDLSKVSDAVRIAKWTLKVAKVDVLIAMAVVLVLELIASTGIIPAFGGAILQEAVDLTAISLALIAGIEPKK
ncbi:MAG: heavy metal translocating P-type ATPase [Lactobacillus sp.]|nr:heavy metal translocating P-type ATPase [Lactobacillus sp.]